MENLKTDLQFDDDARNSLLAGVEKLARAVRGTMGPGGRNVVIEQPNGRPILTKDGVTVAKAVNLNDANENLGAQLVKEAASGAAEIAGDGTTTATVMAYELFKVGTRMVHAGHNGVALRRELKQWAARLEEKLLDKSVPVKTDTEIMQVGAISANGEESIGNHIVDAMTTVGRDGVITVEDAKGFKTYLEKVKGTRIDRGFVSPYFITDQGRNVAVLENPSILLVGSRLSSLKPLLPILEKIHMNSSSLLIVADDIEGEALNALVLNRMRNTLKVCAIKSPEFGQGRTQTMNDLAVLLGTEVYSLGDNEIASATTDNLGKAERVTVGRNETIILGPAGEKESLEKRISEIREAQKSPGLEIHEKNLARRRLAKLAGGIAIIRVGGATEAELRERRDRIDDALHATRAAVAGGYLPGGGSAILKCVSELVEEHDGPTPPGLQLLVEACEKPIKQIAKNCGIVPELVCEKVKSRNSFPFGFNARENNYCNLIDHGIIDPTLVVTSALRHAVSAADNLLSVACCLTLTDE
jgi:chaperonin GroEL